MNVEKVVFAFFIVLAATLNFGFVYGQIDDPTHHDIYELFAAVVVNLIATVLKFGDRTQIGAVHLATSLVAVLQLVSGPGVGVRRARRRRARCPDHRQHRVAVGRRAARQLRVAHPAGVGDGQPAAMTSPIFIALRRLRAPLLVLIAVYTIGIVGFLLIPGQDPEGRTWHMSIFHAFYFITYTASTIGFGEIPYPFNDAQRMWTTASSTCRC